MGNTDEKPEKPSGEAPQPTETKQPEPKTPEPKKSPKQVTVRALQPICEDGNTYNVAKGEPDTDSYTPADTFTTSPQRAARLVELELVEVVE